MTIGIRAHDFGKQTLDVMISKIKGKGFNSIQLALPKALEGFNSGLGSLNPGMAHHVGEAFRKNDIQIAVLGCYINPIASEEEELRLGIDRFKEHIRYARSVGCSIVATETGWLDEGWSNEKENIEEKRFNKLVETVKELVQEAEKFGVFVGIEPVATHTINSPEKMKRLIDEVNSNNLQVVFDPVNLITIDNYHNQEEIISKSLELFGDKIVAVHCKDFVVDKDSVRVVAAGKGQLNYKLLAEYLKENKPFINCLLEDIGEPFMEDSMKYLGDLGL
jgi:sugar phosphate isomerase/epimerase